MNETNSSSSAGDREHFRSLDALRGLAALSIVLVHSTFRSHQAGWLLDLTDNERDGVQLFYVISAFTLCHSFAVRQEREVHPTGNYFLRRFFRIAPLFYLAVLGTFLVFGFKFHGTDPVRLTPFELGLGLVFLNGWNADAINHVAMGGWSVADETIFYMFLPLLLIVVTTFRRAVMLVILSGVLAYAISSFAYGYFHRADWREYFFYFWFPMEFPVFCLGICAYFFWHDHLRRYKNQPHRKWISLALLGVAVPLFFLNQVIDRQAFYISCMAIPLVVLGLSLYEWPLFVNSVTVFLGRISYSIYLTHFFVLLVMSQIFDRYLAHLSGSMLGLAVFLGSTLLVTVPISTVSYYVVEKPGIRFGRQLIQKREKVAVPARL